MAKQILFYILLVFCTEGIRAQYADKNYYLVDSLDLRSLDGSDRHLLDSLVKKYHAATEDSVRIKLIYKLTYLENINVWVKYNKLLLSQTQSLLSGKTGKEYTIFLNRYYGSALYNMNYYYSLTNREDSSIKYLKLCIAPYTAANDQSGLADAYNAMGVHYNRTGKTEEGIKYYQKALMLQEKIGNQDGIARAHITIGLVYRDLDQFDKALEECGKALKIAEEQKLVDTQSEIWNYFGMIYKWSGDTLKAEKAYAKSLELAKTTGDLYNTSAAMLNLGIIYQERAQYAKAIQNYEAALANFKKIDNRNGAAYALNSLATVYNLMSQPDKALKYAAEAHRLCKEMGYPESLVNSSIVLSNTYKRLGKYKEALDLLSYHFELKDSVMNIETQKKILTSQLEFEGQQKVLKVEEEKKLQEFRASQEKKQQQFIIAGICIVLLLVVVFSAFLYNRFRVTKKQKHIIELKEQETQKQNHIISEQKSLVEEKNREITDSINYAKRLQEAILPSLADVEKQLPDSFVFYRPKDIVAGDFYWMETVSLKPKVQDSATDNEQQAAGNELTFIAAADSTGHGVPGALVSVVCSNALNRSLFEFGITDPGAILDKTREIVLDTFAKSNQDVKDGMDISLACIQYSGDRSAVTVKWAGANNPLWYINNGIIKEIKADKQPVGKTDHAKPFTTHTLDLQKGDLLYLFTDGFADQFGGPHGKKFKYKPFGELLLQLHAQKAEVQVKELNAAFEKWRGSLEQVDDICVVSVRL